MLGGKVSARASRGGKKRSPAFIVGVEKENKPILARKLTLSL
jgi:hypothetical protein